MSTISDMPEIPLHPHCQCTLIPVISEIELNRPYEDQSWETWFAEQSKSSQQQMLGEQRFALFSKGLPLASLVSKPEGKIIPITTLVKQMQKEKLLPQNFQFKQQQLRVQVPTARETDQTSLLLQKKRGPDTTWLEKTRSFLRALDIPLNTETRKGVYEAILRARKQWFELKSSGRFGDLEAPNVVNKGQMKSFNKLLSWLGLKIKGKQSEERQVFEGVNTTQLPYLRRRLLSLQTGELPWDLTREEEILNKTKPKKNASRIVKANWEERTRIWWEKVQRWNKSSEVQQSRLTKEIDKIEGIQVTRTFIPLVEVAEQLSRANATERASLRVSTNMLTFSKNKRDATTLFINANVSPQDVRRSVTQSLGETILRAITMDRTIDGKKITTVDATRKQLARLLEVSGWKHIRSVSFDRLETLGPSKYSTTTLPYASSDPITFFKKLHERATFLSQEKLERIYTKSIITQYNTLMRMLSGVRETKSQLSFLSEDSVRQEVIKEIRRSERISRRKIESQRKALQEEQRKYTESLSTLQRQNRAQLSTQRKQLFDEEVEIVRKEYRGEIDNIPKAVLESRINKIAAQRVRDKLVKQSQLNDVQDKKLEVKPPNVNEDIGPTPKTVALEQARQRYETMLQQLPENDRIRLEAIPKEEINRRINLLADEILKGYKIEEDENIEGT